MSDLGNMAEDQHPEIVTEEQALNWVLDQIGALKIVMAGVNYTDLADRKKTAEFRQHAYRVFITKHGGVLGSLAVLYRCQRLSKAAHDALKTEVMGLLGPSLIVGRYGSFSQIGDVGLTEEQARQWVLELLDGLRAARLACNVSFPGDRAKTAAAQKSAERLMMVKHGGVLGMLYAMYRCRILSDVGYGEMRAQAMAVLVPTVVG